MSRISTEEALQLFQNGTYTRAHTFLGAHKEGKNGKESVVFRTWAPKAKSVAVVGDFNDWNGQSHKMTRISENGVWEVAISGVKPFDNYRYAIEEATGKILLKSDPYANHFETPPRNASKYYEMPKFAWTDSAWRTQQKQSSQLTRPMNIYEVHAGSWRLYPDGNPFSYSKLAEELIPYVKEMGYTHIQLMPVTEYPYSGSWGYQTTGYFAPTSRFGTPEDFMKFVDSCHQAEIGVLLDWVPAYFPKDSYALYRFDGSCCYEYTDRRKREQKAWDTCIFDYGRNEVKSFLLSSAVNLLETYHIDGLRVNAVASMLHLNYHKKEGEWAPNIYGGTENLEAIAFLQQLNTTVAEEFPNAVMIAEESTSWPLVTRPVSAGGLGFHYKWNQGWREDILPYMAVDPIGRTHHHNRVTHSFFYSFSEHYILPLSHDAVVHGQGSLMGRMPGDYEIRFAGLRTFFAYTMAHPGKKLLFMGQEFGQFNEWDANQSLEWLLLAFPAHDTLKQFVKALNHFYLEHSELWEIDFSWEGFSWISNDDSRNSVIVFRRINQQGNYIIAVCNFCPVVHKKYRFGVPQAGCYREIFNTDSTAFGGNGYTNDGKIMTEKISFSGYEDSVEITVPPMSVIFLQHQDSVVKKKGT